MDQYEGNGRENIPEKGERFNDGFYETYTKAKSWVTTFLGVIVMAIGVTVVVLISALEGTKEVKAASGTSVKILQMWREENAAEEGVFPEDHGEMILYEGQEYYFVIDEQNESGDITAWHFAYDGGFGYVFRDPKFYILTSITIIIAMFVAYINYTSSIRSVMNTISFGRTLKYYQREKEGIQPFSQYLPEFCAYKNKQLYETARRDIVARAGLNYDAYVKGECKNLEKWQIKQLRRLKHIKIERIYQSDLMQESGGFSRHYALLPMGQKKHKTRFMVSGGVQKTISAGLSGMVVAFGVVLDNWWLGIIYGFTVFMSFITSIIIGTDYAGTTLRNRFIAKGDLLHEFGNVKDMFTNNLHVEDKVV